MAGKKAGRPRLEVDPIELEKLAQMQCTNGEMASFFHVSETTLTRNFGEIIDKGREAGRMSLRRKQLSVAMGGNVAMLIWLGKQYLDQHDKADFDIRPGLTIIVGEDLAKI